MSIWNDHQKLSATYGGITHITHTMDGPWMLFSTGPADPSTMVPDYDVDGLPDAPPPSSGYREADVQGVACWNCAHWSLTNAEDDALDGVCHLWEAQASGHGVCDRFTAHADLLRQGPHTSWLEDQQNMKRDMGDMMMSAKGPSKTVVEFAENSILSSIHLAGEAVEEDGLIWKDILRTGEWSHTPTGQGIVKKRLRIVADGESDPDNGVLSLSEIAKNFDDGAIPYVTIPLSDDERKDHKNIARLNTGFVRKLKLVKDGDFTKLKAGMDFTEPEVKEKVLRGSIPDVSAGVPFGVTRRRDNKFFRAVLDHVCLTRKPFIDGLGPFGLAAADEEAATLPVEDYEEVETQEENQNPPESENEPEPVVLSMRETQTALGQALVQQLGLTTDYVIEDIRGNVAIVFHSVSNMRWDAPFEMTGNSESPVQLSSVREWKAVEGDDLAAADTTPPRTLRSELERAQELRELRLAQPTSNGNGSTGGIQMSVTDLSLEGVELSDEARTRIQGVLEENSRLRNESRQSRVDARITELSEFGLKERPGALKLYRQVMLADDGGPAVVLFSDDGGSEKEKLTALDILDRFIEGLKADGGVVFSDQGLQSGNDNPPPKDAEEEVDELDKRVADAKEALYGKRSRRK